MKARTGVEPDGRAIQQMFAGIAHRYDFLNHLLSASIDRLWRKAAATKVAEYSRTLSRPICLDLCAGTGDLALELGRRLNAWIVAADFCHPMLVRCRAKVTSARLDASIRAVEADGLDLPFPDNVFDAVTIAFGLRNLADRGRGLAEMRRVLKDGGAAVILEFSRPALPLFGSAFEFYFHRILPRVGALVSGHPGAYRYLPDSVRTFPRPSELALLMSSVGFQQVGYRSLSGGVAAIHWGVKPPAGSGEKNGPSE